MKKSLVALAALAVIGAASAQSSVTMYGVADVSASQYSGSSVRGTANEAPATAAGKAGGINNGQSRLGVRGSEDLGGGLKAFFNFEQGINLGNGSTDATTFQRGAYMGLSGNWGEVYAGRRLSPQFYAVATYELTGAANYSAVANKFGYGGASRNDSFAAYTTPTIAGFTGTIGTRLSANDPKNKSTSMMNVIYKQGPLAAALGYDKTQDAADGNVTLGASYNFGMATVAAGYYDPADARKGFSIGASMPFGAATVTLDIARDTGSAKNSTDVVLEGKYALSKRTFAYAAVYNAGATADTGVGSSSVTTTGLGIRHNF